MANNGNTGIGAGMFREVLTKFQDLLAKNEQLLNDLNVFPVPDSDTGSNSSHTLKSGLASSLGQTEDIGGYALSVAKGAATAATGNSGVILAQFLHGLAQGLSQCDSPDQCSPQEWQRALQQGAAVARQSVLTPAEGTMLTVADTAAKVEAQSDFAKYYEAIQIAVRAAVINTQNLLPELKAAKVIDAGALVISYFHDSVALTLGLTVTPLQVTLSKSESLTYSGPALELMFSVVCSQAVKAEIETELSNLGESISVSGIEPNFNFHVHTDKPELVIESCETKVEVTNIRISELGN